MRGLTCSVALADRKEPAHFALRDSHIFRTLQALPSHD
jgi:hypothetical protein